jgi:hypothetical protein
MITCDRAKQLLSEFLDNEISPDLKFAVESHLKICPDCNRLCQDIKFISHKLQIIKPVKVSEKFDQQLRERIINNPNSTKKESSIPFQRLSFGFSGIAVLVILYIFFFTNFESSTSSSPELPTIQSSEQMSRPQAEQFPELAKENPDQNPASRDSLKLESEQIDPSNLELVDQERKEQP